MHANEAARMAAARSGDVGQGLLALRRRWPALFRRDQLVVGEPVRPLRAAHQRRAVRAA